MDLGVPARPCEVRQALGIGLVGLVEPGRQHLVRLAGVDADDRQALRLQPPVKPGGERAALVHHPGQALRLLGKKSRDRSRSYNCRL